MQIALLCWTHCVIGWGFFIFQFWIPTYLKDLGAHSLESMGMLSALPWAVIHPAMWLAGCQVLHAAVLPAVSKKLIHGRPRTAV